MSKIQWTTETWNPTVGCSVKSAGCINCYAKHEAHRMAGNPNPKISSVYQGLTERKGDRIEWTGVVKFLPERLEKPLKTKKPTTWFIDSMSDLFHESVSYKWIDQVFAVMALTPQHTYQVLTKRADRMLEYFEWCERRHDSMGKPVSFCRVDAIEQICINSASDNIPRPSFEIKQFPLPNVWLGVSCENQKEADARIPLLLKTSAAIRWLSCEPLLESIDLTRWTHLLPCPQHPNERSAGWGHLECDCREWFNKQVANGRPAIRWVVAGGESGHNARPCNIEWIRSIVNQCKKADVPVFVKQLGSVPVIREYTAEEYRQKQSPEFEFPEGTMFGNKTGDSKLNGRQVLLRDRKGGDISEFPEDLQIREFPVALN